MNIENILWMYLSDSIHNNKPKSPDLSRHYRQEGHRRTVNLMPLFISGCNVDRICGWKHPCFYVLLLFLITSDWINQPINEIPQGFDISSSFTSDHISEKGTAILR